MESAVHILYLSAKFELRSSAVYGDGDSAHLFDRYRYIFMMYQDIHKHCSISEVIYYSDVKYFVDLLFLNWYTYVEAKQ